jgi:hypothetical protein
MEHELLQLAESYLQNIGASSALSALTSALTIPHEQRAELAAAIADIERVEVAQVENILAHGTVGLAKLLLAKIGLHA